MEFSDWITRKYIDWRGDAYGNERSVTEFAAWIGVSQPLMAKWMRKNGSKPGTSKTINKLIAKFGREVTDILHIEGPITVDDEIQKELEGIPPEYRELFLKDHEAFIHQWLLDHGFEAEDV